MACDKQGSRTCRHTIVYLTGDMGTSSCTVSSDEAHFVTSALQEDARDRAPIDTLIRWMEAIHDPDARSQGATIWDIDVLP
jgi:hypothetical protein